MGLITWYFLFNLNKKELLYLLFLIVIILIPASLVIGVLGYGAISGELTFYCTISLIVLSIMIAAVLSYKNAKGEK